MIAFLLILAMALVSLYEFCQAVNNRYVAKKGRETEARVVSVERAIPSRWRMTQKDQDHIPCDYILLVSWLTRGGRELRRKVTVRKTIRVKDGKRYPFYRPGDTFPVKVDDGRPRTVVVPGSREDQGGLAPIGVWIFCVFILGGMLYLMLKGAA